MMQAEYRQRLVNGAFMIRGAGIFQQDTDVFRRDDGTVTPGYRNFRGSVESTGQFALNQKWVWGWDAVKLTDKTFFSGLQRLDPRDADRSVPDRHDRRHLAALSHRQGRPQLSSTSARMHFYGFSQFDNQKEIADHPSGDGLQIHLRPAGDGRRARLQAQPHEPQPRRDASFDPITTLGANQRAVRAADAPIPAVKNTSNCLLRGVPGTYSRFSAEAELETQHHRFLRADFHALRLCARRRRLDGHPARSRRRELHRHRRKQLRARDADRRPGISLSLHQRAVLGHADDRADRAGHRAAQRAPDRKASERRCAKPDLRRQQPVPGRQILRLGSPGRRRPRQRRRSIHRAAQSRRLLQRAVRAVLSPVRRRTRMRSATSPIPASIPASIPTAPIMWRAFRISPTAS